MEIAAVSNYTIAIFIARNHSDTAPSKHSKTGYLAAAWRALHTV